MSGCGCFYRMADSMETEREGKNAAITVIRWSALVLWVIFVGVFLPFAIGEGTPGNSMGPLAAIWFGLVGIYAVAMCLALKWECVFRRCRSRFRFDGDHDSE